MNKILKMFLGIFVTFLVLMISGGIEITLKSLSISIPEGVGSQFGILIISILLIFLFSRKQIIKFNISKLKIRQLIYPIGLTVLLSILIYLFSMIVGNENHPSATSMSVLQQLIFIVFFASLSEELLFRGFLQNMLEPIRSCGINISNIRLSLPVIISGVLFGIMHFALVSTGASFSLVIQIVVFAMLLGMIAGFFQEKHNNFTFAFIVHMTANLSGLILSIVL
ncbi:CPBP family intramembrane metalloprotease [candidate division WOR-3 bacterium]|nr:CPBP family intramembrane metalloprotease [candidate division WOR-3 bacterium]